MSRKRKRKANRKWWTALYLCLTAACIACILFCVVYLMNSRKQEERAQEQYEKMTEQAVEPAAPEPEPETVEEEEALPSLPIDFEQLRAVNPEIYAWLRIPDTNVDYPILQREGEDQSFYLDHDMYGEPQKAGSIYTEAYNSRDFQDPNTIIYGHNMKNGSMFHNLRYFADQEYFDGHEDLYIYMPGKILHYQIFASYVYDDRHLLGSFDFTDEEVFSEYLDEIMNPRSMSPVLREGCQVTAEDRIVTLSTCVANKPNNRRLVQAVLKEELDAEYRGTAQDEAAGSADAGDSGQSEEAE